MARIRKKHVQQALEFRQHGGKRAGAGRKAKGKRPSEPHRKRDRIDPRHPLHATTRIADDLGSLRKKDLFRALGAATVAVFEHAQNAGTGFRIVHASVQRNHVHLIVEASHEHDLAKGMQVFLSAAAKRINRALWRRTGIRRRGSVFSDRYDARPLSTPRQVRNCLSYVLNNWRRHREDVNRSWNVDPYSSAIWFTGWKERAASPWLYQPPQTYLGLMTWLPKTWLLREGWKKHPLISVREVPGPLFKPKPPRS